MLKSSLLDSAASQLYGEKTEIIYLHYRPFYYSSIMFEFFGQKTSKKMCALLKNQNLFSTYFLNGKLY